MQNTQAHKKKGKILQIHTFPGETEEWSLLDVEVVQM